MSAGRLRVLILAEHASKRFGGEAILPYHYFRLLLTRAVDVHLVVHERTRDELRTLFPTQLDRVHFVKDTLLQKLFFRAGKRLPRRIAEATLGLANQLLTQYAQRAIVRRLRTPSTVIHQPIPVSPRFPSLLSGLDCPLIVGPMNGGMEFPPAFRLAESWFSRTAITVGRSFSDIGNSVFPGKQLADIVLVANQRTRKALPSGVCGRVIELVENGVDLREWQPEMAEPTSPSNNFLFIGRLIDWKALDIAIEALSSIPGAVLDVVGDGPMLASWRAFAEQLDVASRVVFHGWQTQQTCAVMLRQSRALILPSLFECGGAVVLEAMAMARPVIATDWGGPADYLDSTCGILIPPASRTALVAGFVDAMRLLMESPETASAMGVAGRERLSQYFTWEGKIDSIMPLYESLLPQK